MPNPTDDGKTYTFKIRQGVKFHDGSPLTAADVAASWNRIVFPPEGVTSARSANYKPLIEKIENPDPATVVFRLKFATSAFLPALADPFNFIYKKDILDKDQHWYEKNIMGSGPFKFVGYEAGQSIKGERNPDYYHKGLPYLDGIVGIFAPKQATRVEAMRGDRAAVDFRGLPPSARDELQKELGDKITVQESDWNCGSDLFFNHKQKPFDDPAGAPRADPGDRPLGRRAGAVEDRDRQDVGGIVFPGSPLAATKEELQKMAGFWPDIEKSRAEAKRLLKEAGAENLQLRAAEPRRRPALQICRHLAGRPVEQDRRQGDAEGRADRALVRGDAQRAVPGRRTTRSAAATVNPLLDVGSLPAELGRELRLLRGSGRRPSSTTSCCTRPTRKAAGADDRVREAGDGHAGARHQGDLVEPHRAVPLLRQGLEDQPEPFPEPGSVDGLARQIARHADQGP